MKMNKWLVALVLALVLCMMASVAMAATLTPVDGVINLTGDVVLTQPVVVKSGTVTVNLNGHTVSRAQSAEWIVDSSNSTFTSAYALFNAEDAGTIIINGPGTLNSVSNTSDYNMAVWARNGGTVIINGGTYTNVGGKMYEDNGTTINNGELIYSSGGGKITINDGTFKGMNSTFMLNLKDNTGSKIVVNGGTYSACAPGGDDLLPYDPRTARSEPTTIDFVNPEANVTQVGNTMVVSIPVTYTTPKTGDETNIALLVSLMALSAAAFVVLNKKVRFN